MVTLLILDGYGIGKENDYNAIYGNSKNLDFLKQQYPTAKLLASGEAVGLSHGQMGNSETGHLNIGAGRIVYQDLSRINNAINDDSLKDNKVIKEVVNHVKSSGGKVHLMGLLSDGGVHSHINHLKYLLKTLNNCGVKSVLHCFLDGRDVVFNSGIKYLSEIATFIQNNKIDCEIASVIGRVYAMDREKRFDRVKKAYVLLTGGVGDKESNFKEENILKCDNFVKAIENSYKNEIFDEFVMPIKIKGTSFIESGDAIISFNFRTDRMRELIAAFGKQDFNEFERPNLQNLYIATMTEYDKTFDFAHVIMPNESIENCLSKVLSENGKKQFRVTETTKYAHVTFFFNGGIEIPFEGEERELIDSINTQDFSKFPKMRALEITDKAKNAILSGNYDFILINLSNPDMVGHTGNLEATKEAIRCVDKCLMEIANANLAVGGDLIITADHGNAEVMVDENGVKVTSHTTNPVPVVLVSERFENAKLKDGKLCDLAPTVLELLNLSKPKEMTGVSLIVEGEDER